MKTQTDKHQNLSSASVVSDSPNQSNETRAVIQSGLIGAGFWAKCGSIYEGGYLTERQAINAVKRKLEKLNPDLLSKIREAQIKTASSKLKFP